MVRNILKKEIIKSFKILKARVVDFEIKKEERFGDYSSNVAMMLIRQLAEGDPRMTAERIKQELLKSKKFSQYISKIEVAGPGFLNFWLSEKGLLKGLAFICDRKYMLKSGKTKKQKVSLDYLDANPTGPVHLGHARSGFYGDVLSNVLEFFGHKVTREFYVNNSKSSGQIQSLGKTVLGQGEEYKHEQLLKIIKKPEVKKKLKKIKDPREAGFYIAKIIQKENEKFLKQKAKIKFDLFFEEESVYSSGMIEKIIKKLKEKKAVYEKDGALWFKASQYGESEDRVLVRSTGEPTYLLPDIGYHWDRLIRRKNDTTINIFGADHFGYGPRLKGALQALGVKSDRITIFIAQIVRLVSKGKEVKMSKRKGEFVTLERLIDEVGLDAARFFFLMKSLDTHMDFDLDLAKEQSAKNPVYYIQYAGARMSSIIKKSNYREKTTFSSHASIYKLIDPTASPRGEKVVFSLLKKLIQFPEVIEDITKDYQVQRLTTYAYELASEFSQFYRDIKVIGSKNEKELIAIVSLTRKILADTLKLLGISAPEKM